MRVFHGLVLLSVSGGFTFAQQTQTAPKQLAAAKFVDMTAALGFEALFD
jgi:hypothetical protein